MRSATLEKNVC